MCGFVIRRSTWEELEGMWQDLVIENYHQAYNGMGELYTGIVTAEEKIENMKHYIAGLPVWGAWDGERLAGILMGRISSVRLVLYDLFVSLAYRRQGLGRQLVELAIRESGASEITAEVNRANIASQELFRSMQFTCAATSDWLVLHRQDPESE